MGRGSILMHFTSIHDQQLLRSHHQMISWKGVVQHSNIEQVCLFAAVTINPVVLLLPPTASSSTWVTAAA